MNQLVRTGTEGVMDGLESALRRAAVAEAREAAEARAWQRDKDVAAEVRRNELEQAQRMYYDEHGEWESDTIRRRLLVQSRRDETERCLSVERAAEKRADDLARLMSQGYRPRTVAEVLAAASWTAE